MRRRRRPARRWPSPAAPPSAAFRAGEKAERRQDYDRAVLEYSKAAQASTPTTSSYRKSLERARLRASEEHTCAARRLLARGQLQGGARRVPAGPRPQPGVGQRWPQEIEPIETQRQARHRRAATVDQLKERARERALPGLVLGPEAREPLGLSFRNASLREAYQALGRAAGVNFVFDPQFQDQTITLDLRDVPFEQALNALASVGHTFHRVLDSHVVMVVPDTPDQAPRVRAAGGEDVLPLQRRPEGDDRPAAHRAGGAPRGAAARAPTRSPSTTRPDKVAAAERIIEVVDKQRAEVVVEVEILEVNRTRLKEYGIEITSGPPGGRHRGRDLPQADDRRRRCATSNGNPVFTRPARHPRRQPLQRVEPARHQPARRHLPAAARPTPRRACWPTRSSARARARPRRRASATRCRCR